MTERRTKFTPERERTLLDPQASPVDRAGAISCMEADGAVAHEGLISSLVDHESPHLRAAAIKLMLRWQRFEYIELALDRLKHDPDEIVRSRMPMALVFVADASRRFDEIIRALVQSLENDSDVSTAVMAYRAARVLIVPEHWGTTRIDEETFDRQHDVDWKLLEPYRGPAKIPRSSN